MVHWYSRQISSQIHAAWCQGLLPFHRRKTPKRFASICWDFKEHQRHRKGDYTPFSKVTSFQQPWKLDEKRWETFWRYNRCIWRSRSVRVTSCPSLPTDTTRKTLDYIGWWPCYVQEHQRPASRKEKKDFQKIFKENGFDIVIQCNIKTVNYLDLTLNLTNGTYRPYHKPDNIINYVHKYIQPKQHQTELQLYA